MKTITRFIPFLIYFLAAAVSAGAQDINPPLKACASPSLQQGLEERITSLGLLRAVQEKDLCVALVDITDPASPRMAAINANEMMYAASLPKIAILLGAFNKIAAGEMILDSEMDREVTEMIRFSSNRAATQLLNSIGKEYLAELLQSPQYRLYDPDQNGGLWVGKEYGKAPVWKRDPLHNLSHGATVFQIARFYYLLETGRLVSPEVSLQMKEILGEPKIHHKFVKGLEKARPGSHIYRKSGTWKQYHSDSAIIERDGRRYIAAALARSQKGGHWLADLIVALDDLIFH